MEENLVCDICNLEFNSTCIIPKVLQCGHSFCAPCIAKIIIDSHRCPQCRATINGSETFFPVNYSLLRVIDPYNSRRNICGNLIRSIEKMKKEYFLRKDILSVKGSEISSYLEIIEKGLLKLHELTVSENNENDTKKIKEDLKMLEEELKKSEKILHFNFNRMSHSTSVSLKNFKNPLDYLTEICKRVHQDEKIYAVKQIKDKVQYGQVSKYENYLLFHSLSLLEVPQDSSLILFDEVKKCSSKEKLYTFIRIVCNKRNATKTIIFNMFINQMTEKFIKLCTGESGPSFKGCSYRRGKHERIYYSEYYKNIIQVESQHEAKNLLEYGYNDRHYDVKCQHGDLFLYMNHDGNLDIYYSDREGSTPFPPTAKAIAPGDLTSSIDFNDGSSLKISECGIVYTI